MQRAVAVAVVVGLGSSPAAVAHATTCGIPPPAVVLPRFDTPAPRNTHVWITLVGDWKESLFCVPDARCQVEPELELRSSPTRASASVVVPVERRESKSGITLAVELVPRAPLAPNAAHEVWSVDRSGLSEPRLLGAFVTTAELDTKPPVWNGASGGKFDPRPWGRKGIIALDDACGHALATAVVSAASDDLTPPQDLRIGIWGGSYLALSGPPALYHRFPDPRLSLDGRTLVLAVGNTLPEFSDFTGAPRRLGLRVVDLAGNASVTSVVHLEDTEQGCADSEIADTFYDCVAKASIRSRRCGEYLKIPEPCECPPGDLVCSAFCAKAAKRRIPNWEAPSPVWEEASCGERCKQGHGGSCLRLAGRLFHRGGAERARAFDLAGRACELDAKLCGRRSERVCSDYGGCASCEECYR